MRASDYFNSMDEVEAYFNSLNLPDNKKDLFRYFLGLLDNEGDSVPVMINGNEKQIDKSIANIVEMLNTAGIQTLACCSGSKKEHTSAKFKPTCGQISILKTRQNEELVKKLFTDNSIRISFSGEAYLQAAITLYIEGSEAVKKYKWKMIFDKIANLH